MVNIGLNFGPRPRLMRWMALVLMVLAMTVAALVVMDYRGATTYSTSHGEMQLHHTMVSESKGQGPCPGGKLPVYSVCR